MQFHDENVAIHLFRTCWQALRFVTIARNHNACQHVQKFRFAKINTREKINDVTVLNTSLIISNIGKPRHASVFSVCFQIQNCWPTIVEGLWKRFLGNDGVVQGLRAHSGKLWEMFVFCVFCISSITFRNIWVTRLSFLGMFRSP